MNTENIFTFLIFCGFLGLCLRRNFLNITVSLLQIVVGTNALLGLRSSDQGASAFITYLLIFLLFAVLIFLQSIAMLLIKRRSTLNVNELTELRG